VDLFKEWRTFENPPKRDGAPDYTAETFANRLPEFKTLQDRLLAIDTASWPLEQRVDWHVVRAEMNGWDFNYRVLKPWERDPAYYKTLWMERSDVPAHEGSTHHGIVDVWTYQFPLDTESGMKLIGELNAIAPLNEQAKLNLTGNAKELWIAGIRDIKTQSEDLKSL
jgi:alpha-N-acetylglucosamine transferase